MLAIVYWVIYLLCGCAIIRLLLPRMRPIARVWLGLCLGIMLMMWLPALMAFVMDFTVAAHLWAFIPLAALVAASFLLRDKREMQGWDEKETQLLKMLLVVALPLTLLGAYLQWTHNIRPGLNGELRVGQSTYGDLNLHLGIITSLRNASFPADYSIFPGELLAYPFLMDSFSTSLMLFGMSLRDAVVLPGIVMMALTFGGYMVLAQRMASGKRAAVLATLFVFLNGGLGFFYLLDMQGVSLSGPAQSAGSLWGRIQNVLQGWYQTPTNHDSFDLYNLRWSNIICDMFVPQRTFLGGWCQLLPCLYLLYDALVPQLPGVAPCRSIGIIEGSDGPTAVYAHRPFDARRFVLLGLWAGMLPLLHTHSFLALGMVSVGWMVYDLIHARGQRAVSLANWAMYGALAVALAAPQLLKFTFSQIAASTGDSGYLRIHFNWVNNLGNGTLKDNYLWFYIKNIGVPFVLLLLSLLEKNEKRRFVASGAFVIFVISEFVVFQPNVYDNNKLFYVWWALCAVLAADYAVELYDKIKPLRARFAVAAVAVVLFFTSAGLTIARECISDYQLFSAQDVQAAEYIEKNTPADAMFISWTEHTNPVSALAGRRIVCGPGIWLYYHGFDIGERSSQLRAFYADPMGNLDLIERYGVQYIFIGSWERSDLVIAYTTIAENFELVFESSHGDIQIYKVPEEMLPRG